MAKAEQICNSFGRRGKYETYLKKRTNKLWRKAAKSNPEDAPKRRPIKGYSD